ncbi:MAG: KH domain-containing protein [Candidatus Micrarchaeia archaeon]
MKRLLVPGDELPNLKVSGKGVYEEDGKKYVSLIGMYNDEENVFIPLEGVYEPQEGDVLIGLVSEVKPNGYVIETGLPGDTFMSMRDFRERLDVGDIIIAKVRDVDELRNISLVDPAILKGGRILRISPVKVPRVIGKKGSMLQQIKDATGTKIVVGRNGWIWMRDGNEYLAAKAILKIESEAHISGLTDKIAAFLKSGGKDE